jgi:zinc protease
MAERAARRPPRAIPGELETARLANGLEVVLVRNPQAPIVSTALFYRVGARDEPPGRSGLAHFLEHMMFKGSERYGPGEVDRRTQALGGANNAFTSHDLTAYWFSFAADRWREALAVEADRMRGLRLDRAEIDAEREVILEEIAMYEDDPWDALGMAVERALFGEHPYGRPVLGARDDLRRIGRDELADFHARSYRPDRAVLVLAGALDGAALAAVEEAFGAIPPGGGGRPATGLPAPPAGEARVELRKGELTRLLVALPVPPTGAPGHADLRLAATLLADGRASRLQRALVDEGQLCLGAAVALSESAIAAFVAVSADLLPGSPVGEVEKRLRDELARLREEPIPEAELARARQVFFADWVHALERIHEQAIAAGFAAALFDLGQPDRLLAEIAAATPESVGAAARRWLDPVRGAVLGVCRGAGGAG